MLENNLREAKKFMKNTLAVVRKRRSLKIKENQQLLNEKIPAHSIKY